MSHVMKYGPRRPASVASTEQLAEATCRRLRLNGGDAAFFATVFGYVREEELAGRDTYALWSQYRRDKHSDLATAAYLEALASTRKMGRPAL